MSGVAVVHPGVDGQIGFRCEHRYAERAADVSNKGQNRRPCDVRTDPRTGREKQ